MDFVEQTKITLRLSGTETLSSSPKSTAIPTELSRAGSVYRRDMNMLIS
jgi:hypothetical protein